METLRDLVNKINGEKKKLTFPTGLCDRVGCTFAHHLGDVDRTVHTVTKSDGTEHRLSLQLY